MSDHITTANIFRYSDESGVLIEAPLVHLSSFIGLTLMKLKTEIPDIEPMDLAKAQVVAINTEFGSKLMWWHIMEVTTLVRNEMLEIKKKNTCQEPELQQPTE